ncbi:hypothetical protein AAVH_24535 [Aphelenchoides avenae]|nr:hypothetical protein AAVH_24535 [Aphelenchus avenae]
MSEVDATRGFRCVVVGNQLIDGDNPPRPLTAQQLDKLSAYEREAGKYEQWESQYMKAPQFYYTGAYGTSPPLPKAPCLCESCKDYLLAGMPNYLDYGQR